MRLFSPAHSIDWLVTIFLIHSNGVSNGPGGAINTLQGSELHVEYSSFRNNFAVSGGAINSMGDFLYVLESSFSNNVGTAMVRNKQRMIERSRNLASSVLTPPLVSPTILFV